jgi:hypothetical protein
MCYSPLLPEPRADIVKKGICEGDELSYSRCKYYTKVLKDEGKNEEYLIQKYRPDPMLNMVSYEPKSGCEFFKVVKSKNGYVVFCDALQRYLTKHEIELCMKDFERCPIRRVLSLRV